MEPIEVPLAHITLRGWQRNPEGKIKILALHGWLDNANSFLPLAYELPDDIHFLSLDLPGHGLSDWRSKGSSYHFLDYVTDLQPLLKALNWEHPILMGHSLGAGISSIAAAAYKKIIYKTILIEGLGPLSNTAEETPNFYRRFLKQHFNLEEQTRHFYKSFEDVLERRLKASPMHNSSAKLILERSLQESASGWSWKSDPRHMGRNPIRLTEEQVLSFLNEIECPTLLFEADKGEYFHFVHKVLPKRLQQIPHAEHVKLKGDHHIHMDYPKLLAPKIIEFLNS